MPGRFFLIRPVDEIAQVLSVSNPSIAKQSPRSDIAPGEELVVFDQGDLKLMRWGMIPSGRVNARGRPVMETIINARSETLFGKSAFDGVRRCVIPVDGWFEWTGERRKKTRWMISSAEGAPLFFAAIADTWSGPAGVQVDQVAAVTCAPNTDLVRIHHRMGVLLTPEGVDAWVSGPLEVARALMRPWPNGLLQIQEGGEPA